MVIEEAPAAGTVHAACGGVQMSSAVEVSPQPVELAVGGMTCAACAARVQRRLNKLDGVSASVNYATERASVQVAAGMAVDVLVAEVERAGYQARLIEPETAEAGLGEDRVRCLWRRLVVALLGARDVAVLGEDDSEQRVPVEALRVGDRFVVRPGETIATDGQVTNGTSAVDTSAMTGESLPVEVGPGDAVTGGTTAMAGRLVVRAARVCADTQLAQLVALVERAQTDKARVQRLADRISGVFVPAVVAAVLTCGRWPASRWSRRSAPGWRY